MSIKSKVLAATATLTLVGGVGTVTALSAGAATPSCGHDCIDIFSREFGTHHHPNFELESAHYGVDRGVCVGVAGTAVQNERVSLQPCGVSAKTVWILDINDSPA